jgi:PKD repeat protein
MNVDFSADKLTADVGEVVTFTDLTDNSPTHWSWRFDSEGESIVQNPTFSFLTTGFKNITLLAGKVGAGGVEIKNSFIEILASLLLDLFPTAAAAYSLRKLRAAYTGDCIRVRRSSDNAEQNIGFASDVLDTAALLSFVGAGDGFVTTWYDQSGSGRDATQSTGANQPQIVSSGSVILDNGKPTLKFDGSNDILRINYFDYYGGGISKLFTSTVAKRNLSTLSTRIIFCHNNEGGSPADRSFASGFTQSSGRFAGHFSTNNAGNSINNFQIWDDLTQFNLTTIFDTNNATPANRVIVYANNVSTYNATTDAQQGNLSVATNIPLTIGGTNGNIALWQGDIQEVIFYNSDQSSNRTGIQTNTNLFYSIY